MIPLIGISSCLIGQNVRYDGFNRVQHLILSELKGRAELFPVCPEVECGMSIPREPMDLFQTRDGVRLIAVGSGMDFTERINIWIEEKLCEFDKRIPGGFILKSRSPSCAVASAALHSGGNLLQDGTGLFADALKKRFPGIPIVEETELLTGNDVGDFVERASVVREVWNC